MKKLLVFVTTLVILSFILFYSGKTAREDFAEANYSAKCLYALYGDGRYNLPDTFTGNIKLGTIELFGDNYEDNCKQPNGSIDFPEIPVDELTDAVDNFGKKVGRQARKISK